jgi:excisionase family DNA binding protein
MAEATHSDLGAGVEAQTRPAGKAGSHEGFGPLTLAQAASYLAVSTDTIRRWIASARLPHYWIPPACGKGMRGKLLFRRGELDRWLRRYRNGLAPSGAPPSEEMP